MAHKITLLDGGLGQELIKRSSAPPHPLWSTKVRMNEPHLVSDIHRDFCLAGAKVICLNTYAVSRHRLDTYAPEESLEQMLETASQVANIGISNAGVSGSVAIVASMPPLNASYDHTVAPDFESAYPQYRELIQLQKERVNAFLLETMSTIAEASAGAKAIRDEGVVGAVAFTVSDSDASLLRSGESLEEAIEAVMPFAPDALLINCSIPEMVTEGLKIVAKSGVRFGGYANGFTSVEALVPGSTVDLLSQRKDLVPAEYLEFVKDWMALGAEIIGGCCEIGPSHIAAIAEYCQREGIAITEHLAP